MTAPTIVDPTIVEPNRLGDLLKFEEPNGLYSREAVSVDYPFGTVVARTAAGIVRFNPKATDTSNIAIGIMALPGVMIARHAIVQEGALIWPAGMTEQQLTTAKEQLATRGILVRKGA